MDFIDISGQIPANFYTQIESKKWSDRKEALEVIEKAVSVPNIQNVDFSELVRALKKIIAKDSNIVVVTLAAKCLCHLAQGLRENFAPYANSCLTTLFEKFKEKKPNVISVIREAVDAAFLGTTLEDIYEDIIQFLDNKNPQIKSEMAVFLTRIFSNFSTQVRNKKTLRPLVNALVKTLSDMDATVRDSSAMAIGTAMKVIGEPLMMPIIGDVEPIKISKIKEFCEKAEIITATTNGQDHAVVAPELTNGQQDVAPAQTNGETDENGLDDEDQLYEMLEAVDITGQIPANFYTQMESKKWSDRKEALEVIEKVTSVPKIQNADFSELVRILKKTVAKDSNIVVVTSAAKCLCQLAKGLRINFAPYANSCLTTLFEKFKEKKPNVISVIREAVDAAFLGTTLEDIFEDVVQFLDNKNPQIKSEMAVFLTRIFSNFPIQVRNKKILRPLINALIKTLSDMDATVRDSSAMAIGTAMKVLGEPLMMTLIADVEPIKISKIKEFCEKAQVKKVPQSVLNALNSINNAAPAPTTNHQAPPPVRSSSATMVRSVGSKRPPPSSKVTAPKTASASLPAPTSNATVKRTATIIKRSTVPKRASGLPQPPMPPPAVPAPVVAPVAVVPPPPPTIIATPTTTNTAQQHFSAPTSTPAKPIFNTNANTITNNVVQTAPAPAPKLSNQDNLDIIVFRLISDQQDEVMQSLTEIEETLSDDSEHAYRSRINQIIDLACVQLIKSLDIHRTNPAGNPQSHKVRRLSDCLVKLFARRQLVSAASQQSIRFLLVQLFTLTQTCGNMNQDDEIIMKSLNNLASAVMDGFEPANMMCILTGLLNEPSPTSIVEPIKKAIIRSMRSFK